MSYPSPSTYRDADPDTNALMQLQDRIRAGDLTPGERKMLWRLVGVIHDSRVETGHTADSWLHVVQERYDEVLAVTPGSTAAKESA